MTPTDKLIKRLGDLGFTSIDIYGVVGYWRRQDCYRWEGWAVKDGIQRSIGSYNTITECSKMALSFSVIDINHYEFYVGKY